VSQKPEDEQAYDRVDDDRDKGCPERYQGRGIIGGRVQLAECAAGRIVPCGPYPAIVAFIEAELPKDRISDRLIPSPIPSQPRHRHWCCIMGSVSPDLATPKATSASYQTIEAKAKRPPHLRFLATSVICKRWSSWQLGVAWSFGALLHWRRGLEPLVEL
jgi:hypothetical protein